MLENGDRVVAMLLMTEGTHILCPKGNETQFKPLFHLKTFKKNIFIQKQPK